ncbi:integrin alpha-5-like, partial [Ctenocephalides felis]
NKNTSRGEQMDQKSDQWFGATLSSVGVNGPVVACAPRYVFRSNTITSTRSSQVNTRSKEEKRDPVGTCYLAKNNFTEFVEFSPCRTSK